MKKWFLLFLIGLGMLLMPSIAHASTWQLGLPKPLQTKKVWMSGYLPIKHNRLISNLYQRKMMVLDNQHGPNVYTRNFDMFKHVNATGESKVNKSDLKSKYLELKPNVYQIDVGQHVASTYLIKILNHNQLELWQLANHHFRHVAKFTAQPYHHSIWRYFAN